MNVKIETRESISVHHLHKGQHQIHRDYGLWICSVGGCKAPPNPVVRMRYFEFYSLSHMYDGEGVYYDSNARPQPVGAGQGILITPRHVHFYGGGAKCYIEDSICFCGPVADALCKNGIIRSGVIDIGKARRLLPIARLAADPALESQLNANIELQKLLMELYHKNPGASRQEKYSQFNELLQQLKENSSRWWTIEEMAEFCNLSPAQFRRVFTLRTGMLPKAYIDRLKLLQAAEALANTQAAIENIAARFGYQDQFHFSKRFKQITGFSPQRYRNEFFIGTK